MRGGTITGTLLGAVVAGVAGGVLLHASVPFPGTSAQLTSPQTPTSSSPATSASPSAPTDSTSPSKKPSPTEDPSPTKTGPASKFTRAALLPGTDFVERGWAKADVLSLSDGVGDPASTLCTSVPSDVAGLTAAYAATYRGLNTYGAEQVVRFRTVAEAEAAFADLTTRVERCDTDPKRAARATIGTRHEPELPLSGAVWWNTAPKEDGVSAQGVIGLVRMGDRIAYLTLASEINDPSTTVKVESLLTQAGRRLV